MKLKTILMVCALGLVVPAFAEKEARKETPVGRQMESFNNAFKAFRKETDPAKGAALARDAQQAVARTLGELPEMLAKMPDGPEKAKAAAEFRKMLGKVYVSLCEVEEAFLDGKIDEVAKLAAGLRDMKKAGHDKFVEEE